MSSTKDLIIGAILAIAGLLGLINFLMLVHEMNPEDGNSKSAWIIFIALLLLIAAGGYIAGFPVE